MAPLSSSLFRLKVGYRLGTIRPQTMSLGLLRLHIKEEQECQQEDQSLFNIAEEGEHTTEEGEQEETTADVTRPASGLIHERRIKLGYYPVQAGCRLKDWSQRVFELDFRTCELYLLSRLGPKREVGYIQRDCEVRAGSQLTIQDTTNQHSDATLWTFELTFASDGPNRRTVTFGSPQKEQRDRWVSAIDSIIQEKNGLQNRWNSYVTDKRESLEEQFADMCTHPQLMTQVLQHANNIHPATFSEILPHPGLEASSRVGGMSSAQSSSAMKRTQSSPTSSSREMFRRQGSLPSMRPTQLAVYAIVDVRAEARATAVHKRYLKSQGI